MTDNVKKSLKEGADTLRSAAEDAKEAAAEKGAELKERAKAEAENLYTRGKDEVRTRANEAQTRAAEETERTAAAFRHAAKDFDDDDIRARAAAHLAEGIGSAAERIRQTELTDVVRDVRSFARTNPLLFFAGAAAAGFALARLAKASERRETHSHPALEGPEHDLDEAHLPARGVHTPPIPTNSARPNGHYSA